MCRTAIGILMGLVLTTVAPRAATDLARFDGKPQFKEGKALGYFVWRDGDTWKLRWTTFGAEHRRARRTSRRAGRTSSRENIRWSCRSGRV